MKKTIKKLLREVLLNETVNKFEYQVRDIGGSDVYYKKKKGGDVWSFIDKTEFEKDSNKDNIIKHKKK
jgi:hypothetical protein